MGISRKDEKKYEEGEVRRGDIMSGCLPVSLPATAQSSSLPSYCSIVHWVV